MLKGLLLNVPGYEILGELGRGGMGVVYKARHLKLNRLAALKMVLAGTHAGPQALARIQVEAEAVASLDHPNIVHVHEVGEHQQCPYLALEFVDGGPLDARLAGRPLPPRDAARLVETLARAMHVAHLRGILHRDLKPQNVLLTKDGTPKITDFGLAKRLEGESQTYSGTVLGTPSYMAPEQARGKTRDIGPAADVYALGAILYECLTGRPPFVGASVMDTLALVQSQEVTPPRQVARNTPRDLDTICLKCLQKDAGQRYVSAELLANDLRRFLNSEAIAARPVATFERLRLWGRRRPALAGLVGVSVVAVLLLAAGGIWSDLQIRSALDRAQRNEVKAQERLLAALAAGDDFYVEFATFWLDKQAGQDQRQLKFLEKALAHYQSLADQDTDDPSLRARQGVAHMRMGQIYEQLRRTREARDEYQKAVAVQTALHASSPDDASYRKEFADTLNWQGELFRTTNDPNKAAESYAQAIALLTPLAADRTARHQLGRTTYNSALLVAGSDRQEARRRYQRAIELLTAVVQEDDSALDARQDLAHAWLNLGVLLHDSANLQEAESAYRQALEQLEKLARQDYKKPAYRYDRALVLGNLGNLLAGGKQPEQAEAPYRAAEKLLTALVEGFPDRPAYHAELANSCNSLGTLLYSRGHKDQSEKHWLRAATSWQKLLEQEAANPQYLHRAGIVQGNLGLLYLDDLKQLSQAIAALEAALGYLDKAARLRPDDKETGQLIVQRSRTLARAYQRGDDVERAATAARRILDLPLATDADRYAAAGVLALCATQVSRSDAPGTKEDKRRRRDAFAEQAVKALERVDPLRHQRAFHVLREADFEVLRERADFRTLAASWQQRKARP